MEVLKDEETEQPSIADLQQQLAEANDIAAKAQMRVSC
jgi:hypothetical protein